jgi:hypothetical protein
VVWVCDLLVRGGKTVTAGQVVPSAGELAVFCRPVASASRSEPEYAAKSPVDVVHEGCRRVADRFLKVGLIEGDESGDVDN